MAKKTKVDARRKRASALLAQLHDAGVKIVNIKGQETMTLDQLTAASKLSKAALKDISTKGIDFTAWGAWTLRF